MNRQPFYHTATVLFTATREIDRWEFERVLKRAFRGMLVKGLLNNSIECEQCNAEPGDPQDLVE